MSTNQPETLDAETAFAIIHATDYAPAFFEKLATTYGIAPENEAEAVKMLEQAARLRAAYDALQEKQASATNGILDMVDQQLNATIGPAVDTTQVAAAAGAQDPARAHAVLSLLSSL